jgi:hypothetical protein
MNESADAKAWNVFSQVEAMKPFLRACNWDALEQQAQTLCLEHASEGNTRRIARISLRSYQDALTSALNFAVSRASSSDAKAIYFEFDMDYDWRSWFFICPVFPEHWDRLLGRDYSEEFDGPEMPRFARIYAELQFIGLASDACMIGYLIARTFASFGRASQRFAHSGVTLGIAFHDQDEIIRMYEDAKAA